MRLDHAGRLLTRRAQEFSKKSWIANRGTMTSGFRAVRSAALAFRSTYYGRPSPIASSSIDAGVDDFSHPLGIHRLFNRPALNRVSSQSPFVADSEPPNLVLLISL
jgi:hypothetical protein